MRSPANRQTVQLTLWVKPAVKHELQRIAEAEDLTVSRTGAAALVTFGALELLLDPDLARRAQEPEASPSLSWGGRETFGRSLGELRDTALELESLDVYACAASVETMAFTSDQAEERLAGVMSTPCFLRETVGARLIFV